MFFFKTRQTVEKLQSLISSDGRFRNLRDSLHRTDPPCIPYLGMYLSDLTFIEEGTPNFTDNGLLNFAKMRMVRLKKTTFLNSSFFYVFSRLPMSSVRSGKSNKPRTKLNLFQRLSTTCLILAGSWRTKICIRNLWF
jgi:hypothetical protein